APVFRTGFHAAALRRYSSSSSPREAAIPLRGCYRILYLYDVAEAIHLDRLRGLRESSRLEAPAGPVPPVPHDLPFERPPVSEPIDTIRLDGANRIAGSAKYYDYGVVSIELEVPFESEWDALVLESSRLVASSELENRAAEWLRGALARARAALLKPYD